MKKIFICLLVSLAIFMNVFVQATEADTLVEATPTAEVIVTPESTPEPPPDPTAAPTETPSVTPSVAAPFNFSVVSSEGNKELILDSFETTLSFTVTPKGTEDFTIVKVVNEDTGNPYIYNEEVGKDSFWERTESILFNESASDKTITFTLHWKDFLGNERKTTSNFKLIVAKPSLTVSAAVDGAIVPGAPTVIKYHIANVGNVAVKNVLLQDPTAAYLDNSIIFSPEEHLAPGAIFERQASIILDGEATLSPSVSFIYNNETLTVSGETLKLIATDVIPILTLSCDKLIADYKGAMHTFNYTISNTTQVTLKNVYVYDSDEENAGVVDGPFDVEVGAIHTGSYQTQVDKAGYYKFKITYSYEGADGEKQQSAKTDEAIKLPGDIYMEIVKATPEKLDDTGEMTFTLLVTNGSGAELKNIAIEEESSLIDRIELNNTIPAASDTAPSQFKYDVTVKIPIEATLVQFNLRYTINDELFIINAGYPIEYIGGTEPPTETPVEETPIISTPTVPPVEQNNNLNVLLILLLIFVIVFILVFIIIFIILKNKKNAKTANISVKRKIITALDDFDDEDFDEEDFDEDLSTTVGADESLDKTTTFTVPPYTPDEDEETDGDVNSITSSILSNDEINEDDFDDEGVKIYKKK